MKNLIIIALVLLGSATVSCKKSYSCVTTIFTKDIENKFTETYEPILLNVTKKGLEAHKAKEENAYEGMAQGGMNVHVECEIL